jgi:hypothetical protein
MKTADSLKKLIHNSIVETGMQTDQRILKDALERLEKVRQDRLAAARPNVGRLIMKSRITEAPESTRTRMQSQRSQERAPELLHAIMDGTITRREFAKVAGIWLFCEIFGEPLVDKAKASVAKQIDEIARAVAPEQEYKLDLVSRLFGNFAAANYKFVPGTSNPYLKGIHPDDLRAAASFDRVVSRLVENLTVVDDLMDAAQLEGNIIALGSPMSNYLSRIVLQYENMTGGPTDGFTRTGHNPLFHLPFEYIFDAKYLRKEFLMTRRFAGKREHQVPNWSIRDMSVGKVLCPQVDSDGTLKTDFLLITKLPKILSSDAYDRGEEIIIFGGTHGIGTKAIDLLFQDETILSAIEKKVRNTPYWQALIEIERITHLDRQRLSVPFSLNSEVRCAPVVCRDSEIHKHLKP